MHNNPLQKILLIDDDTEFQETASAFLAASQYGVWQVTCPDDAFEVLRQEDFDLIICDLNMPWTMGPEAEDYCHSYEVGVKTIRELAWAMPMQPIIAVSAIPQFELERVTQGIGSLYSLSKPCSKQELLDLVRRTLALKLSEAVH